MATTGGSNFVLNIVELQNTITNASGLTPIAALTATVSQIQEMVIYDEKRIATNTISKYNTSPIQIVDPINIGPTGGLSIAGATVYGGTGSGTGPTGPTGSISSTPSFASLSVAGSIINSGGVGTYLSDRAGTDLSYINGSTVDFPNFSGMIIVNNTTTTGTVTMWLCGGGSATALGSSGINGGTGTIAYVLGINGYRWTNNTGVTISTAFSLIRSRSTG